MDIITADRISDRIVDILNDELVSMKIAERVDGLTLLAGQLLALKGLQNTMPVPLPAEIALLYSYIDAVLGQLL